MGSNKTILFYPELPHPRTIMAKICQTLNYTYSNALKEDYLLGFKWKDETYYALNAQVLQVISHLKIFNLNCTDISKNYVYKAYSLVFGNPLAVDPLSFSGLIVCKSNRNAAHDGVILQGPISDMDSRKSYCILIDNSEGDNVIDFRVPIFLNSIPIVYLKYRRKQARFSNKNICVELAPSQKVFSTEEIRSLITFAHTIGMEYGELDVLRDKHSQNIYVVDANNTPFGPPNGLSENDSYYLLKLLCGSFEETFARGLSN